METLDRYLVLTYTGIDLSRGLIKMMEKDIEKILVSEEEIQAKIRDLAGQLTEDYKDRFPLAIGVLKGAMPFMADLAKKNGYIPGNGFYGCF